MDRQPVAGRPGWFQLILQALGAGIVGYVGIGLVLVLLTQLVDGSGAFATRLLASDDGPWPAFDSRSVAGWAGNVGLAVAIAAAFTGPLVLTLDRFDRGRPAPELVFLGALTGTLVATLLPDDAESATFTGLAVAVIALRYLVFAPDGRVRAARLPARTACLVVVVAGVTGTALTAWRSWDTPLIVAGSSTVNWTEVPRSALQRGAAAPVRVLQVRLENSGLRTVRIVSVTGVGTPPGAIEGIRREVGIPDTRRRRYEPTRLGPLPPGGRGELLLVVRADCSAFFGARLRLGLAGGGTNVVDLGNPTTSVDCGTQGP